MADQQNNIPQQNSNFPLTGQTMEGMDVMNMGQISMTNPTRVDAAGDSLDSLAPIFPPQNFEVPDISFSNSVSPNADFNQSMFSSAHVLGTSNSLFTNVTAPSGHMMTGQPITASGQQQGQVGQQGQQMTFFPPASNSPPGTSSSEDSDDLPLAQLAKRATGPPGSTTPPTTTAGPAPSPTTSTTTTNDVSPENSPSQGTQPAKKGKASKRKKRKDPNEPQKPVSAYALFFRDTQATIKGHNPGASFGEVSKIVASMWDQLDPDHKDVYKKKTEMAKKQYLKQLAAYRASQVSQSAAEEAEKSPSPPGMGVSPSVMGGNQGMPVTSNLHPMGAGPPPGQVMTTSGMPVTMAGQMMSQQQQLSQQQMLQMTPQMMHQQQQQHMQQMQHQMQQQQQMRMQQQQQQQMTMGQQASPSPPQQQQHSPQQQQQQSSPPAPTYNSPPHVGQTGPTGYQSGMVDHNMFGFSQPGMEMDMNYSPCVRSGCGNQARENPAWDSEYCSNDCVITHCRDIFTNWVAGRSGSNTFPVK